MIWRSSQKLQKYFAEVLKFKKKISTTNEMDDSYMCIKLHSFPNGRTLIFAMLKETAIFVNIAVP